MPTRLFHEHAYYKMFEQESKNQSLYDCITITKTDGETVTESVIRKVSWLNAQLLEILRLWNTKLENPELGKNGRSYSYNQHMVQRTCNACWFICSWYIESTFIDFSQ